MTSEDENMAPVQNATYQSSSIPRAQAFNVEGPANLSTRNAPA